MFFTEFVPQKNDEIHLDIKNNFNIVYPKVGPCFPIVHTLRSVSAPQKNCTPKIVDPPNKFDFVISPLKSINKWPKDKFNPDVGR